MNYLFDLPSELQYYIFRFIVLDMINSSLNKPGDRIFVARCRYQGMNMKQAMSYPIIGPRFRPVDNIIDNKKSFTKTIWKLTSILKSLSEHENSLKMNRPIRDLVLRDKYYRIELYTITVFYRRFIYNRKSVT